MISQLSNMSSFGLLSNGTDVTPAEPQKDSMWPLVAGLFAFLALFMSIWEISQHLRHYNKPYLQKYVVRILWMVPIYAMNSWVAMNLPVIAIYVDTLRECYEAFVIYSFMKYLLNFLFYEMDAEVTIDCKPGVQHLFPICFLPKCVGGRRFLNRCKHGILQYTVIRPITTFLALFFELLGVYGEREGHYGPGYAYIYLLVINNISQMIAMYCLVIFYTCYKYELTPMRPLPKFLCIKAVVFFSFFQGVIIAILLRMKIITQAFIPEIDNHADIARNLQDFLICFEMLVAAVAHLFAFSHKPFVDLAAVNDPICFSFMRILDLTDERSDVNDHLRQIRIRLRDVFSRRRRRIFESNVNDENSPLIPLQPRDSKNRRSSQLLQSYESV